MSLPHRPVCAYDVLVWRGFLFVQHTWFLMCQRSRKSSELFVSWPEASECPFGKDLAISDCRSQRGNIPPPLPTHTKRLCSVVFCEHFKIPASSFYKMKSLDRVSWKCCSKCMPRARRVPGQGKHLCAPHLLEWVKQELNMKQTWQILKLSYCAWVIVWSTLSWKTLWDTYRPCLLHHHGPTEHGKTACDGCHASV